MFSIGPYRFTNKVFVAPMAGITDQPYRKICRQHGAGHAVSEMITADQSLQSSKKTIQRCNFETDSVPVSAQITGADPKAMRHAAQIQVQNGAHIIDINMGCPAKKVCNKLSGSALLKDLQLAQHILQEVVDGVSVPVTLKTRLGYANGEENILQFAEIAQGAGIQALTIHGRTREQMYTGSACYHLIGQVKKMLNIPVIANGDITCGEKAEQVFLETNADAIMIGRAAQGNPWIFREVNGYLAGEAIEKPSVIDLKMTLLQHLEAIYLYYGEYSGCRIARKHIAWYTHALPESNCFRKQMYAFDTTIEQYRFTSQYLDQLLT